MKQCPKCKTRKELTEFYNRRNKIGNSPYCKPCTTSQTLERQRELKRKAIDYKGGKCIKCGYNKCESAMEFHHLNPNNKDFGLGQVHSTKWSSKITNELDKCVLVCCNCHRELHSGISSLSSNG